MPSWHERIADPTFGDATLDRRVHNAHRVELQGEPMRRKAARRAAPVDAKAGT
ncbi:ATP-binding protein [Belnapia sp. F-4-1]|uniref:ATP-binding protein n=1 Tax=Belnapia sp. F-4-1 TaxID=1545443 RepID=UPI0035107628